MIPEHLKALRLVDLQLSTRAKNALTGYAQTNLRGHSGIDTVGNLLAWRPQDLLKVPGLGRGSLAEVVATLAELKLELRSPDLEIDPVVAAALAPLPPK